MSKCEHCGAHDHEEKEENLKAEVVKLVIALIIFATAFFKVVPEKIATWLFVVAYILSGYACFYKNQDSGINISSAALENLGDMRKVNKKKIVIATIIGILLITLISM